MIIDRSHRRWIYGTVLAAVLATGLYGWLESTSPQHLTGGTTTGLWYGVGGATLMVYAGLLSAHRRVARWPLLPRRAWMLKGHIWLGLLSFWLILLHSGFRWGGTLEQVLWVVFGVVVISGVVGLVFQKMLPRLMSERIAEETPYEQMPYVCRQLTRQGVQLAEALTSCGTDRSGSQGVTARVQLRAYFDRDIVPFLTGEAPTSSELYDTARTRERFALYQALPEFAEDRSKLAELEQVCLRRRQLAVQEKLHRWLHGWLLLHIPLSVGLLVLGLAHIVMSLYY